MKIPEKIRTYCPHCKKQVVHKVKVYKKGKTRPTAQGQKRHELKTKGYTSKIAGKVIVYKQSKKPIFVLVCSECGKKHTKAYKTRTKKIPEITKE